MNLTWQYYDTSLVSKHLGTEFHHNMVKTPPDVRLYLKFDDSREPALPRGTTYRQAFRKGPASYLLIDPNYCPLPNLTKDIWKLGGTRLLLPLTIDTINKKITLICGQPLIAPSPLYLQNLAFLYAGYTWGLVFALPEHYLKYLERLAKAGLIQNSGIQDDPPLVELGPNVPALKQTTHPFVLTNQYRIDPKVSAKIPQNLQHRYKIAPLSLFEGILTLATAEPTVNWAVQQNVVSLLAKEQLRPRYLQTDRSGLSHLLTYNSTLDISSNAKTLSKISERYTKEDGPHITIIDPEILREKLENRTGTNVDLVTAILTTAIKKKASDVHIVPQCEDIRITFRLDNLLYDYPQKLPPSLGKELINTIKILCDISIEVDDKPKNGRHTVSEGDRLIDMRVASQRTTYGDALSIRFSDRTQSTKNIYDLGMPPIVEQILQRTIDSDHGLTLVTGPTGSGKTTTLYAVLYTIDRKHHHVMTCEDPVEREIPLISQTTISGQLPYELYIEGALRRDPDYIMVGEVRSLSTAKALIHASETGHCVYSTLHTNSAAAAPKRLLNLGVENFAVADNLKASVAQRLVPVLCPECTEPDKDAFALLEKRKVNPDWLGNKPTFLTSHGCDKCNENGVTGRMLIAEAFLVTRDVKDLIYKNEPVHKIQEAQTASGSPTMFQIAIEKAARGRLSLREALELQEET